MNIRSITSILNPFAIRAKNERKLETTSDRDANASYDQGNQTPNRHMTQEELDIVLSKIRELNGVKINNLQVRLANEDGLIRVFVEDMDGKVVRRIPEKELWSFLRNPEQKTGNILNKAL